MKKEQKRKILFYGILAGALLLFAACAAHLAPYDPYEQNLELSLLPPSAAHWMGTDRYGRDLFSRILSGGMNQRVGIALAMLLHPSLLLADEPTSALDVVSQAQVLRELQALQQKEQTGMVLVTHNLAVLEQMADRVAVLKDGNIVEQGETRTVFDHPKDEYTKNLLAAVPGRGKNDA